MPGGFLLLLMLQAAPGAPPRSDRVVVVQPGVSHRAGWIRRFFFGVGWRELWATPIRVPIANLDTLRGGLTAFEEGGAAQSHTLRFSAPGGRIYSFRSVEKDAARGFHGLRRAPPNVWIANEQISAMFPIAALPAGELERAAGVIPTERWLAVLPDDPRLGKWRDDFKGMLGIFERRFSKSESSFPELPGAVEVSASDSLLARLRRSTADRIEQPEYLRARLMDLLIGDWDRHNTQWVWIGFDRDSVRWWRVNPRDRDWAFARFDRFLWGTARLFYPIWTVYSPGYGRLKGLTLKAEVPDRLLLTELDRAAWDSVAAAMHDSLSDAVLDRAIGTLPPEFQSKAFDYFRQSLRGRRDLLPEEARKYYAKLAEMVLVRGTAEPELAEVTRDPDGSVVLELRNAARELFFHRRFVPGETRELRLDLEGGADTVRLRGARDGIPIRIITGDPGDVVADSTGGDRVRVYDDSGTARILATGNVRRIHHAFAPPPPPNQWGMRRDWGHGLNVAPWFAVRPELGVVLGAGPVFYTYGFRKSPYQSRVIVRAGTTTKIRKLNADLHADFRFEHPNRRLTLLGEALNADMIRYYGLGNERQRSANDRFHHVVQQRYDFEPVFAFGIGPARLELGGLLQWSKPDTGRITLLSTERPYGSGSFTEAGGLMRIAFDSRDNSERSTKGVFVEVTGRIIPAALDVTRSFGSVELVGTTFLTARRLPAAPTLALRAGGQRVFGTYPFFEAAALGGKYSVRGLTTRRFTGDASLYGNLELRLDFKNLGLGETGVLALTDVGRVFLAGETSNRWHTAFGGGLWFMRGQNQVMTATLAKSRGEPIRFYVNSGFHF